jgi:hypothetical protein
MTIKPFTPLRNSAESSSDQIPNLTVLNQLRQQISYVGSRDPMKSLQLGNDRKSGLKKSKKFKVGNFFLGFFQN